jgi:hypothetical protein
MRAFPSVILAGLFLTACASSVRPVEQDGTDLWLAAGRPYEEVLASVRTAIDPALPAERLPYL